jgi:Flavin containing amine oxidoreductase
VAYFAGEHTRKDHPASVEGAIWSGQDVANSVCRAAGGCTYVSFFSPPLLLLFSSLLYSL